MPDCTVIPVLGYRDVEKAVSWLCEAFGFTERWRAGSHRAQLAVGDGAVALSEQRGNSNSGPQSHGHSLMVRIADVDRHYTHAMQFGAQILQPPEDFPYGERQYSVMDIGGHVWTFSQSIADLAPEEWGGISAEKR